MSQKDLKVFGSRLRQLRREEGLYQEQLAEKLCQIHTAHTSKTDLRIDGNRISKWERAFQGTDGREWRPSRKQMIYLIEAFVTKLTPETAQTWANRAGYQFDQQEIEVIFLPAPDVSSPYDPLEPDEKPEPERLLATERVLFGIEQACQEIQKIVTQPAIPWLVAIDGIGGIGKTSLATVVTTEIMVTDRFKSCFWISAKQAEFSFDMSIRETKGPALNTATLIDSLLEQLNSEYVLGRTPQEKLVILSELLKEDPYLIVIDNLETIVDYEALVPLLRQLANPTKFLLTSRYSLRDYSDVYALSLSELTPVDAMAFIKYEADIRGFSVLARAPQHQLERIYEVIGGNPLALKLVIGQLRVLPLSKILDNLKQARGKKIDELYTYIYWQAWHILDDISRQVLLVMPLAQDGPFDQLMAISQLESDLLGQALECLTVYSLVEVSGDLDERRYRIHRLTETFLLEEVIKWQK